MSDTPSVLALLAHPDDAEFTCAGTLALLRQRGWRVHIASMTPGQCGSATLPPEEISAIRREEAIRAVAVLNGCFHCLECEDCFVRHDPETVKKVIKLVRHVKPTLMFVHSPSDYICDHEAASVIGRDAAFWAAVPNIKTPEVAPLSYVPHLYYVDPMEGTDAFGQVVMPSTVIDIDGVIDTKESMLVRHSSQREWLREHHGMDEYTAVMRNMGRKRGLLADCTFAEGFRQHLGHGYPKDNLLQEKLAPYTTVLSAANPQGIHV